MNETNSHMAQQLAGVASRFQEQRTGHLPTAVTAVLLEDTLVAEYTDADRDSIERADDDGLRADSSE